MGEPHSSTTDWETFHQQIRRSVTDAAWQTWIEPLDSDFDGIGDDSNLSGADRTYALGGGIPSSAVPIFQEEGITLLIGTSAGGESVDPELGLPRMRTYWNHE